MLIQLKKDQASAGVIHFLVLFLFFVSASVFLTAQSSFSAQTREQCERCCTNSIQDEYYSEQCRLKCFRNPDHCTDKRNKQETREDVTQPRSLTSTPGNGERVRPQRVHPRPTHPRVSTPGPSVSGPVGPTPGPPAMSGPPAGAQAPQPQTHAGSPNRGLTPRQASQKGMLVFPSPLNLVPGRESEAAAQILNLNGISPQHPNFNAGVQAMTSILQNFARNNPSGGQMPTEDMQRVIIQLKP